MAVSRRIFEMIFLISCQVAAIECVFRGSLFERHNNKLMNTTDVYAEHACISVVECSMICTGEGEKCVAVNLHCIGQKCSCQLISKLAENFSPDKLMSNNSWTSIIKSGSSYATTEPPQPAVLYNSSCLVFGGPGKLDGPWGVDVDPNTDTLYVADFNNHRVCLYTMTGDVITCHTGFVPAQTGDSFWYPYGIALSTDGQLVVCDFHRVMVFTPTVSDLTLVQKWGGRNSAGSGLGQFHYPYAVHVSGRHVYVCDNSNDRIQILNLDDPLDISVIDAANSGTPGTLVPNDISIDIHTGLAYLASYTHIIIYDVSTRQYVRNITAADLGQTSIEVYTVATDNIGRLFIADNANDVIHIITPDSVYLQQLGTPGACPGCISDPFLAVHPVSGQIIVTDYSTNYIKVYHLI